MTAQRTILVVDDDQELRNGLKAVLDKRGYRTLEAGDGREARQLIDQHSPDLVILDMMMPRLGGLAVLEHFQGKTGAPPFIMITATEGATHKSDAERLGVVQYIHKPFSMERLLEGVDKIVGTPAVHERKVASIQCRCSGCGSRIKAPVQLLGQTRTCPSCKRSFVVAVQAPEDEGPKLMMDEGLPPTPTSRGPGRWSS